MGRQGEGTLARHRRVHGQNRPGFPEEMEESGRMIYLKTTETHIFNDFNIDIA